MPDLADDDAVVSGESGAWRRLARAFVSTDSYGLVLLLVVVTYVVSVSAAEARAASVVLVVQLGTVWLTLRTSRARPVVRRVADIVLCLAGIVAIGSFFVHQRGTELGGIFAVCCLLYLIAPFSIVRHLIIRRDIDIESLLGAVAAYLLIGMFFAFAYPGGRPVRQRAILRLGGHGSLGQDMFSSLVTMTTLGYGNLVPSANPGQTLSVLEAIIGQLFLVAAVGKIISSLPRSG